MTRLTTLSRSKLRRRLNFAPGVTVALFILLVTYAVVGRLISLNYVVVWMCDVEFFRGGSPSNATISSVEWFIIVGVLALVVQLLLAICAVLTNRFRLLDFLLGLVNVCLVVTFAEATAVAEALEETNTRMEPNGLVINRQAYYTS